VTADQTVAVVQRVLSAPPEVVFDEWIDPDAWVEWMCPRPARATRIELDASVGGDYRIEIEDEGVCFDVTGRYLELDRPRYLRFTWSCSIWDDPTIESVVRVMLEPLGDQQTLMTIEHVLLPPHLVPGHEDGWARVAGQLAARLPTGIESRRGR
jgi:uncharacterized protein YndB with AHSA1/START domain